MCEEQEPFEYEGYDIVTDKIRGFNLTDISELHSSSVDECNVDESGIHFTGYTNCTVCVVKGKGDSKECYELNIDEDLFDELLKETEGFLYTDPMNKDD